MNDSRLPFELELHLHGEREKQKPSVGCFVLWFGFVEALYVYPLGLLVLVALLRASFFFLFRTGMETEIYLQTSESLPALLSIWLSPEHYIL